MLFSVNHHGALLGVAELAGADLLAIRRAAGDPFPERVQADYMVHKDVLARFWPVGLPVPPVCVSQRSDAALVIVDPPTVSLSSMLAAWVAYELGCCPIVLCGMDCYDGGTYWHEPDAKSNGNILTTAAHVERWRVQMGPVVPASFLRAASGPLVAVYGEMENAIHSAA